MKVTENEYNEKMQEYKEKHRVEIETYACCSKTINHPIKDGIVYAPIGETVLVAPKMPKTNKLGKIVFYKDDEPIEYYILKAINEKPTDINFNPAQYTYTLSQ